MLACYLAIALGLATATPNPPTWRYDVRVQDDELRVEARFPPGSGDDFIVGAPRFVQGLGIRNVRCAQGCILKYRFSLGPALGRLKDTERYGDLLTTRPGDWLLRPRHAPADGRFDIGLWAPAPLRVATGLAPKNGRFLGHATDLGRLPVIAVGRFEIIRMQVAGTPLSLAVDPTQFPLRRQQLLGWASRNAHPIGRYFGGFPVPHALILVLPVPHNAVRFGTAYGAGGAVVRMFLGTQAIPEVLERDWVLRHELAHLALPNLGPRHRWMEEGLATYLEVLVKAKSGRSSELAMWRELRDGISQGLPRGQPLDGTRRWGETYWGGALFWLLADLEIRRISGHELTLADALRATVRAGATLQAHWKVRPLLTIADAALPQPVLMPLYERFGVRGSTFDGEALWQRLGVLRSGTGTLHIEESPQSSLRRRLSQPWSAAHRDGPRESRRRPAPHSTNW